MRSGGTAQEHATAALPDITVKISFSDEMTFSSSTLGCRKSQIRLDPARFDAVGLGDPSKSKPMESMPLASGWHTNDNLHYSAVICSWFVIPMVNRSGSCNPHW
jgi:hypothetical protein